MRTIVNFFKSYKGFFTFYGVYLQVFLAVGAITVSIIDRNLVIENWPIAILILVVIFLLPFLVVGLSYLRGTFTKGFRLFIFSTFRVETFAGVGLIVLLLFTGLFFLNLGRGYYDGTQIFLNVLFLNLLFLYFLALIYANRFQIKQSSDLLIRKKGHAKVYLYQDGAIRHIPDPETLQLLGYSFEDVVDINETEFKAYNVKAELGSVKRARLVQEQESPGEIWMIFGDGRKLIPDHYTLDFILRFDERSVETVTKQELAQWRELSPLVSILKIMRVIAW